MSHAVARLDVLAVFAVAAANVREVITPPTINKTKPAAVALKIPLTL
jgi:hypothetical protein